MGRCDPATGAACRYGRTHLESSDLTAVLAAHRDRQPSITVPGINQLGKRQYHPSVAALAVGRELVVALMQPGNAS